MNAKIETISGSMALDSNGYPTIEVRVVLTDGTISRSFSPRGSTTGDYEAVVVEHAGADTLSQVVQPAIHNVQTLIGPALIGRRCDNQTALDEVIVNIDQTANLSVLGGNVAVATSTAIAKAAAASRRCNVAEYLRDSENLRLPTPIFNLFDGSRCEGSNIGGVEFLLAPVRCGNVESALKMARDVRNCVRETLRERGTIAAESAQGAIEISSPDCVLPLRMITGALHKLGWTDDDYFLGLDMAASDYFDGQSYTYTWLPENDTADTATMLAKSYVSLIEKFNVKYLEDPFSEHDETNWHSLIHSGKSKGLIIAGDDLFASSPARIKRAAELNLANAAVIKPNQIGTVTQALQAIRAARSSGMTVLVSQRSGETDDDFITHLAVAGGADYLKAGGLSRIDRIAKYNALLRIEAERMQKIDSPNLKAAE